MKNTLQRPFFLPALAAGLLPLATAVIGQDLAVIESTSEEGMAHPESAASETLSDVLPEAVTREHFAALIEHSPFIRTLDLSKSLILTGIAQIEDDTVATMLDLKTRQSYTLSQGEVSNEGWQLMEVKGDPSDVESLIAKVRVAGAEVVSVRYEESPPPVTGRRGGVMVSTRIGNGKPGGGTGPHGGPDPRVLTPDQMADARKGARDIRGGFQADGYGDREKIPDAVVSKLSKLSVQQRESVNVKMYEYRNRGLGMKERQGIYNKLLDREVQRR